MTGAQRGGDDDKPNGAMDGMLSTAQTCTNTSVPAARRLSSVSRPLCLRSKLLEKGKRKGRSLGRITYKTMFTISVFVIAVVLGIAVGLDSSSVTIDLQSINVEITQYYFPPSLTIICPVTPSDSISYVSKPEEFFYANSTNLPANVKLEKYKTGNGASYTPVFLVSKPTTANTGEYTCCYPSKITNETTQSNETCYRTKLTVSESASYDLTSSSDSVNISVTLGRNNYFWLVDEPLPPSSITCKVGTQNVPANVKTTSEDSFNQFVITATTKENLVTYDCTLVYVIPNVPTPRIIQKHITLSEAATPAYAWNGLPEAALGNGKSAANSNTIGFSLIAVITVMLFGRCFSL